VFAHACQLGAEGIVSKKVDGAYQARAASGSRSAIRPASRCSGSGARFGIDAPGSRQRRRVELIRYRRRLLAELGVGYE
jgi:hypothetical protein